MSYRQVHWMKFLKHKRFPLNREHQGSLIPGNRMSCPKDRRSHHWGHTPQSERMTEQSPEVGGPKDLSHHGFLLSSIAALFGLRCACVNLQRSVASVTRNSLTRTRAQQWDWRWSPWGLASVGAHRVPLHLQVSPQAISTYHANVWPIRASYIGRFF